MVLARTGHYRYAYLLKSILSAATLFHAMKIPETLKKAKRKVFTMAGANPFSFLKLFGRDRTLDFLLGSTFFTIFAEGKNTSDLTQLWMQEQVGATIKQRTSYTTIFGGLMVLSGKKLVPAMMNTFGARMYTTLALLSGSIGYALNAKVGKSIPMAYIALAFLLPGINATSNVAMKAMATDRAVASGLGRGEFAAATANMRALVVAIAPMLYGKMYSHQVSQKRDPAVTWFLVALLGCIVPQLISLFIDSQEFPETKKATGTRQPSDSK